MPFSMTGAPASTFTPPGRKLSKGGWGVMANAFRPTMSLGRPGRCTSPAEIMVVTPPCMVESIQPIWPWRGVQSPNTGRTWLSMRPGAVVGGVDRADLALARRPVAEHGVHVAVDEAGCDAGLARVDDGLRAFEVAVFLLADRHDQAVVHHQGVGVEDGLVDVAREQQPDVLYDDLARLCAGCDFCHFVVSSSWGGEGVRLSDTSSPRTVRSRVSMTKSSQCATASGDSSGSPRKAVSVCRFEV